MERYEVACCTQQNKLFCCAEFLALHFNKNAKLAVASVIIWYGYVLSSGAAMCYQCE